MAIERFTDFRIHPYLERERVQVARRQLKKKRIPSIISAGIKLSSSSIYLTYIKYKSKFKLFNKLNNLFIYFSNEFTNYSIILFIAYIKKNVVII